MKVMGLFLMAGLAFSSLLATQAKADNPIRCRHHGELINDDGSVTLTGLTFEYAGTVYPMTGHSIGICRFCNFSSAVTQQTESILREGQAWIGDDGNFEGLVGTKTLILSVTCKK
jgi:hypothetical protein